MNPRAGFDLSAFWGPHPETPAVIAHRWLASVSRLRAIDPIFANFYKGVDGKGVLLATDPETIETEIVANATDDGYMFTTKSDIRGSGPKIFNFRISAGSRWRNNVRFGTDYRYVPDPSIITYRIFRAATLAVAEGFDAERAYSYPTKLLDLWPRPPNANPTFPIAWISYVSARLTPLVTPPSTAIVERRPDGGLLMAATEDTFDVGNSAHMAIARDIEAAVAPLNGLPWQTEQHLS